MRRRTQPEAPSTSHSSSSTRTGLPTWSETKHHYLHLLLFLLVVYGVVWMYTDRVPAPKSALSTPPTEFSEERARRFLTPLLDKIGYRVPGTPENDVYTTKYILEAIEDIRNAAGCKRTNSCPEIEVSVQHPTGSFVLKFMDFFITNRFTNLTNIVVRLSSPSANANAKANENTGAILVNTHYDSALGGLGATDAGALVAVMMEMLRNILNSNEDQFPLTYPLIFLFNGAEEALMMASQGFMASHPWAKDIRMVLNMDSTGVGAAALFQQNSDRVLKAYAAAAPYPHSTSFAVDFFKTEKFPGDTDFRIFRDYSDHRINGADFAYYRNGYMYHTLIDDDAHLLNGSIQHMGENLHATLRYIMKNKVLHQSETAEINVFFDILGKVMILLPEVQANICAIIVLTICIPFFFFNYATRSLSYSNLFTRVLPSFLSIVVGIIFAFMYTSLVGVLLLYVKPLSWFTYRALLLPLFYLPAVLGILFSQLFFHKFAIRKYIAKGTTEKMPKALEAVRHESAVGVIFFYVLLVIATWNMGSHYFFLIPAFCVAIGTWVNATNLFSPLTSKFLYLNIVAIPCIFNIDFAYVALELIVPVMGRSGPLVPGDVVVAALCTTTAILASLPLLPLFHQRPAFRSLIKLFSLLFFASLLLAVPLSHPYSKDTPKRVIVQHATQAYPQVSTETHSFLSVASLDAIPPGKEIFDDVFRYFKKDLFPKTLEQTDEYDWQELTPFDILIRGFKLKSTAPVYNDGHKVVPPVIEVLHELVHPENNTRDLHLRVTYSGAEWSTLRFPGKLVQWDVNEPIPPPHRGFNVFRHVGGFGVDKWEIKLTFSGNEKIEFRATGTHFKPSSLVSQIGAFFPGWYTVMNIVTSMSTYTL